MSESLSLFAKSVNEYTLAIVKITIFVLTEYKSGAIIKRA